MTQLIATRPDARQRPDHIPSDGDQTTGCRHPGDRAANRGRTRDLVSLVRRLTAPHRARLLAAALLLTISGAIGLAQPLIVRRLLTHPHVGSSALLLVLLVSLSAIVSGIGQFHLSVAAEETVRDSRVLLSRHIIRMPIPVFRRYEPGDLLARVTGDTSLLRQAVLQILVQSVTNGLMAAGTLVLMVLLDPVLVLVTLAVMLLLAVLIGFALPRIRRASLDSQNAVGDLGDALETTIGALTTVKASGAESREDGRIALAADAAFRHGVVRARWGAASSGLAGLAMQLMFLVVLGVGGARVSHGDISVATLIAFLLYVLYIAGPAMSLISVSTCLQAVFASLERVDHVLRQPQEPLGPSSIPRQRVCDTDESGPALTFEGVTFTHPGRDQPALHNFNLTVHAPGLTALVGPSGSGKSTALSLIERFAIPEAGAITVNGTPLQDWDLTRLRATIGYVEQDAPIVAGTLRDNLTYTVERADDEQLWEVIRLTRLTGLLERLGGNLDTPIQHRGVSLSGGERQRVAIARALLRTPRLLMLDEVTSQLDADSEAALRDVVRDISTRTPVLAVAHRLSTVRDAGSIAVVCEGTVIDSGRHRELLSRCDVYASLVANQLMEPVSAHTG